MISEPVTAVCRSFTPTNLSFGKRSLPWAISLSTASGRRSTTRTSSRWGHSQTGHDQSGIALYACADNGQHLRVFPAAILGHNSGHSAPCAERLQECRPRWQGGIPVAGSLRMIVPTTVGSLCFILSPWTLTHFIPVTF